ncbi:hypothetical protein, partial [Serratia grimesii]|uniref:hypothetical protein n=1 Tax=Serratia grimesii TaxID=82995 RepID=UPI0021B77A88
CFNKSKGVFITGSKLKALLNPQPSWGFSVHKKPVGMTPLAGETAPLLRNSFALHLSSRDVAAQSAVA